MKYISKISPIYKEFFFVLDNAEEKAEYWFLSALGTK